MLLLACARREATHDLKFRERYLISRSLLHERHCPRRFVLLTQSNVAHDTCEIKAETSQAHHEYRAILVACGPFMRSCARCGEDLRQRTRNHVTSPEQLMDTGKPNQAVIYLKSCDHRVISSRQIGTWV